MALLALPRELRDEIYSLVFSSESPQDPSQLRVRGDATLALQLPPCMLTCKQFYSEGLPIYIRSTQLALPIVVNVNRVKLELVTRASEVVLDNLQSVSFSNVEHFRIEFPSEECIKWDRQKDLPWRHNHRYGPTVYFTGIVSMERVDGIECSTSFSPAIAFLHRLPRLRHVELSTLHIGDVPDRECRGARHYLDLLSLATLPMLRSIKVVVRLGGIRGKLYKACLRRGDDGLRRMDKKIKARLEDGMGLISWLQESLRNAGKTVVVEGSCVIVGRDAHREFAHMIHCRT